MVRYFKWDLFESTTNFNIGKYARLYDLKDIF